MTPPRGGAGGGAGDQPPSPSSFTSPRTNRFAPRTTRQPKTTARKWPKFFKWAPAGAKLARMWPSVSMVLVEFIQEGVFLIFKNLNVQFSFQNSHLWKTVNVCELFNFTSYFQNVKFTFKIQWVSKFGVTNFSFLSVTEVKRPEMTKLVTRIIANPVVKLKLFWNRTVPKIII